MTQNIAADGSTTELANAGGEGVAVARGTFGGGTLTFEVALDGTNYVSAGAAGVLTAAGAFAFKLPTNISAKTRFTLVGATNPDINVDVYKSL